MDENSLDNAAAGSEKSTNPPTPPMLPPSYTSPNLPPSKPKSRKLLIIAITLITLIICVSILFAYFERVLTRYAAIGLSGHSINHRSDFQETVIEDNDSPNKILVINIEGVIMDSSMDGYDQNIVKNIKNELEMAENDDQVKAVILKVDSPGGEVLASEFISQNIKEFQEQSGKPVIACFANLAASGGYYVSANARWIVAHEMTITGSIGVIMHSYNYRGLLNKVGVRPVVFKSGKFKDMLRGDKADNEIEPEEASMIQSLINENYDRFKTVVSTGRKNAARQNKTTGKALIENWEDYADGRIFSGKQAYELGFVDELGDFRVAVSRAKKIAGIRQAQLIRYDSIVNLGTLLKRFVGADIGHIRIDTGMNAMNLKTGRMYFLSEYLTP